MVEVDVWHNGYTVYVARVDVQPKLENNGYGQTLIKAVKLDLEELNPPVQFVALNRDEELDNPSDDPDPSYDGGNNEIWRKVSHCKQEVFDAVMDVIGTQ